MRARVWSLAACLVAIGGCTKRDVQSNLHSACGDLEKVQIEVVTGNPGAHTNGTVVTAEFENNRHFKSAFAHTETLSIEPVAGGSGFSMDDHWVYVTGEFKGTTGGSSPDQPSDPDTKEPRKIWPYWPIVIRSTMAIGADGTEFVADFTTPGEAWVRCRSGGPVLVYDHPTQNLLETILAGQSAKFKITPSATALDQSAGTTDTKDPVYVEAVSTALSLKVTSVPLEP